VSIRSTPVRRRDAIDSGREDRVKYLALIYADEGAWETFTEAEQQAAYELYYAFGREAREAGVMLGGEELGPTRSASTVRVREGETLVTDGPYAEVKEALGGYYLLECDSMDEALDWAAKIPGASHGSVEVRPIHESEDNSAARAADREEVAS
jgi:hypothetical protein